MSLSKKKKLKRTTSKDTAVRPDATLGCAVMRSDGTICGARAAHFRQIAGRNHFCCANHAKILIAGGFCVHAL